MNNHHRKPREGWAPTILLTTLSSVSKVGRVSKDKVLVSVGCWRVSFELNTLEFEDEHPL